MTLAAGGAWTARGGFGTPHSRTGVVARIEAAALPLSILFATVLTRGPRLGDPAIHMDEEFYLLVADRMWRGALPYVDIWDRKPIGLFLLYAAARPLSPDGIVAYQLLAAAFAAATAFVIARIASRMTGRSGTIAAAVAYVATLPLLGGVGGQSPVFYGLPMALAALCVVKAGEARREAPFRGLALAAMGLCGLAIQIKYTAAVQGAALGTALLALAWRRSHGDVGRVAAQAAAWVALALAPTLAAWAAYAAMGHGAAFLDANVFSILRVREPPGETGEANLALTALRIGPLLAIAMLGALRMALGARPGTKSGAPTGVLIAWTLGTAAEFFVVGHHYPHYALPAVAPLAVWAGAAAGGGAVSVAVVAVLAAWNVATLGAAPWVRRDANIAAIRSLAQTAAPYTSHGALYIADGPPALYLATGAALATPYAFPEHLNTQAESEAVDAPRAMAALLARRPAAILTADTPLEHPPNPATAALLAHALAADYRPQATLPDVFKGRRLTLFVRRDLP